MKKKLSVLILCVLVPCVIIVCTLMFKGKFYAWISLLIGVLACVPFFLRFEAGETNVKRLVLISIMVALSVIGRIIFAPIPGFKPVTAIVIITAMCFGSEAGFMTGALSAVISNMYFGQGPWTPFQMLSWGIIGFIAGIIANLLRKSKFSLAVYGAVSGVLFSLIMDVWSVLWADSFFNIKRYIAFIATALPFTVEYAISNVIFLLLFSKPIAKILDRIKLKYGL